jgi:metal-responsive CopG/Arc/MetJ family transcriptional regulator
MRTVQMTLDEDLVTAIDGLVKELDTTRSAFTRQALREAIDRINIQKLEAKHRQGYAAHPAGGNEFSIWENEHDWGDE